MQLSQHRLHHMPGVRLAAPETAFGEGRLVVLTYEELVERDSEYARRSMTDESHPVFMEWPGAAEDRQIATLAHLAFLLSPPVPLSSSHLDPALSITYGIGIRQVGIADRALLALPGTEKVTEEAAAAWGTRVSSLIEIGIKVDSAILLPARAIQVALANSTRPAIGCVAMVVALEALLIPKMLGAENRRTLAARVLRTLEAAGYSLTGEQREEVGKVVKWAYDWRSDILHGRSLMHAKWEDVYWPLLSLCGPLNLSAIAVGRGCDGSGILDAFHTWVSSEEAE